MFAEIDPMAGSWAILELLAAVNVIGAVRCFTRWRKGEKDELPWALAFAVLVVLCVLVGIAMPLPGANRGGSQ